MKKTTFLVMAGCVAAFLVAGVLGAGAGESGLKAPTEPITIDGKKPVRFPHATHLGMGLQCGVCHHDAEHKPLSDDVMAGKAADELKCRTCHNPDFANKELQTPKNVFHARCKVCHKAGVDGKKGPTKCSACHIKKAKKAIEGC